MSLDPFTSYNKLRKDRINFDKMGLALESQGQKGSDEARFVFFKAV